MTYNKTLLENYLIRLERTMKSVSVSERAEIVTEIKSHVLDSLEKNPGTTLEEVLRNLGEPETVANKYLLERGLKTQPAPRHPVLKWLVIGFLGTVGIMAASVIFLVMHFSPLIEVNEKENKVRLFGGTLKIDGDFNAMNDNGNFQIRFSDGEGEIAASKSAGVQTVEKGKKIKVKFLNGKIDAKTSTDNVLKWKCKTLGDSHPAKIATISEGYALDFGSKGAVKCELAVPKEAILAVEGTNGKLAVDRPAFGIDANFTNGKVSINPDHALDYQFNMKVVNGTSDTFTSSGSKQALPVNVSLVNGAISKENDYEEDEE